MLVLLTPTVKSIPQQQQRRQRMKSFIAVPWRHIRSTILTMVMLASVSLLINRMPNSIAWVEASAVTATSSNSKSQRTNSPRTNAISSSKGNNHHHNHHEHCDGRPTIPAKRHACNLFLWDAPSALLYKWCRHLVKDHIYEGKGGYLFVRFESNSILQLLYPCTRFAPNRCFFCGGSFPDHLELWWSKKNLYTPFDRYLDQTYTDAMSLKDETGTTTTMKGKTKKTGISSATTSPFSKKKLHKSAEIVKSPPTFAFHRKYVEDITSLFDGISEKDELRKAVIEWIGQRKKLAMKHNKSYNNNRETIFNFGTCAGVVYATTTTIQKPTKNVNNKSKWLLNSITDWLSFMIMKTVDEIILIQLIENKQRQGAAEAKSP
jgi:hypothetical protein